MRLICKVIWNLSNKNIMQPSKVSITQLLADGHTFYVPFYQRAYVWTEKLWSRFIRDMEYISKTDEEYFIGSVILKKLGANGIETARWSVVDGQQRLTTLAIFYKVISLKNPALHNPFDKRFRLDNDELNIKHSLNDKEAFEKIANLVEDVEIPSNETSNLIRAYNYFRENVDVNKVVHLNIQARLWFIAIYLESEENEHKIFDTINSLGMSLNTEELLKNHCFTVASLEQYKTIWRPVFEADDACLTYWKTSTSIGRTSKKTISDRFFHTLLQIIMYDPRNNIPSTDRTEFRKYDDENEFNYYQKVIETGCWDKVEFAKEITEYAKLYRKIYSKKAIQENPDSYRNPLNRILLVVFTLDVQTALPYILYILKNVSDKSEQDKIFTLLESYIIRRQICNKVCKNYSDLFTESLIGQKVQTYDALVTYLKTKKPNESLHMPYDSEVEDGFKDNSSMTAEKARGVIYLLESKLREKEHSQTILHPFHKYSLEHLMPQNWEENWPAPSDLNELELFEFKRERNRIINTLGNMAIITQSLNSSVSNNKWQKKLNSGLREKAVDLITMKEVVNKPKWDEKAIAERAEWLATKANEIWVNAISSGENEEEEMEKVKITLDRTQYSLKEGEYTSKSAFVVNAVKAYAQKHNSTIADLRAIFQDTLLKNYKRLGFICTRDDIQQKALVNGRIPTMEEKHNWYHCNNDDAWAKDFDGVEYVVNTEITKHSAEAVRAIMEADGWTVHKK